MSIPDVSKQYSRRIPKLNLLKYLILIILILQFSFNKIIAAQPQEVVTEKGAIIYDLTPPTIPIVIDDGESTNSRTQLHASWSSEDPQSGIAEYQYAIGTTQGKAGTDVVGWTSVGTNTEITATGLSLIVGQIYYFNVKAKNGSNRWSQVGSSDGITVINQTPQILSLLPENNSTFIEGDLINIQVQAQDADGDGLEYRYLVDSQVIQDWTISSTYSWQTQVGDVGLKTITVEVKDAYGGIASASSEVFLYRIVPGPE